MSENKECLFYIDHNPPEYSGTWGGAIHKGACKVNSTDCKDTGGCFIKNLYSKLQAKEQENNQLKEDEKSLLNVIDDLQKEKNKWVEKYNDLGQDFDQLKQKEQEVNKFKQALDEIEKNIKGYCKNMCMAETREICETCQNTEILDIINKTKE